MVPLPNLDSLVGSYTPPLSTHRLRRRQQAARRYPPQLPRTTTTPSLGYLARTWRLVVDGTPRLLFRHQTRVSQRIETRTRWPPRPRNNLSSAQAPLPRSPSSIVDARRSRPPNLLSFHPYLPKSHRRTFLVPTSNHLLVPSSPLLHTPPLGDGERRRSCRRRRVSSPTLLPSDRFQCGGPSTQHSGSERSRVPA